MSNDFYNGDDTQLATGTGENSQLAPETDTEGLGDFTQPEPEDETDVSLADLIGESDEENAENEGLDSPPNQEQPEEEKQDEKPADYYRSQAEVDAVVQRRLKDARAKWEREQAAKMPQGVTYEQLIDAYVEKQARELLEKNPDMNMTLDVAKMIVKGQQSAAQPVQEQPTATEDERQQKIEAWKQSLIDEEPLLRIAVGDPNITVVQYAKQNSAFEAALRAGNTPMQAYAIAKALEPHMKQREAAAKATAQKELINQVKNSNARATTPVNAKSSGKRTSLDDFVKTAPMERLKALLAEHGSVYLGG